MSSSIVIPPYMPKDIKKSMFFSSGVVNNAVIILPDEVNAPPRYLKKSTFINGV